MNILDIKNRSVDHLTETIWWNKGLTKLNEDTISNYNEFIDNLVQVKGPYLEKVQPPKFSNQPWPYYCENHDIQHEVQSAIRDVVFGGGDGRLYRHQGRAVGSILDSVHGDTEDDVIITVPTATGKTECFVIPALDTAIRNQQEREFPRQIKSLIIYPQKALETDQLDRLVKYTYEINNQRPSTEGVKIGIYDGDTPRGQYKISSGQNVRGLECPECDQKLGWDQDSGTMVCTNTEEHRRPVEIDFLELTRDDIEENGADILLTNPEALEFRFFSSDSRDLVNSDLLDLVVFDEAHVWNGNGGKAISQFISRLRNRYGSTMVLASATIANPKEFASDLLNRTETGIDHIDFEAGNVDTRHRSTSEFTSLDFLSPQNGFRMLREIREGNPDVSDLKSLAEASEKEVQSTLTLLQRIGYLDSQQEATEHAEELLDEIEKRNTIEDNELQSVFNEVLRFREQIADSLVNEVPQVAEIFDQFGEENFIEVERLLESIFTDQIQENQFETLTNLLEWCKLGGVLYDRYHYFIKPYVNFFYCPDCQSMFTERVSEGGRDHHSLREVKFCSNCHTPYYVDRGEEYAIGEPCSCSRRSYTEPPMQTTTFLSYFLSKLGRDMKEFGAGKVLVFSNRRGDAEGVGSLMMKLDYSLESERMMVSLLEEQDDDQFYSVSNLREDLYEELKEYYVKQPYTYLEDETLSQGLFSQLGALANPLDKGNHRKLWDAGILSVRPESENDEINLIANEIVKILAFKPHTDLDQSNSIKIDSLKSKLSNSVPTYFDSAPDLDAKLDEALSVLEQADIISRERERSSDEVVTILTLRRNFLELDVQKEACVCEFCYSGWPFWDRSYCPDCGEHLVEVDRDSYDKVEFDQEEYSLDHWGNVVLGHGVDPLVSAVHKAGIKTDTRNKIEEGFGANPPKINVVSATNTLELGIDIGTLDCIAGLGIPPTKTSYVQRAGRTGRSLDQSSMVFTVARPHNAVDNFYFEDIESRFLNAPSKPVQINHLNYDILKTQVMSEVLTYLNLNDLDYGRFERFKTGQDIDDVINEVYDGVEALLDTVDENQDSIKEHLEGAFKSGEEDLEQALEDLFESPSEVKQRVLRRLFKFYTTFRALEKETGQGAQGLRRRRVIQEEILQELEREVGYLPMLLSSAGMISQYRSTEDSVALFREKESEENGQVHLSYESKSVSQALRESYPEAMDTYGGVDYEVVSAQVSRDEIFSTSVCTNQLCTLPYNEYPALEVCPLCGDDLEEISVHEYLGAVLKSSRSRKRTRPLIMRGVDF
ncbi:DEAD/DEAH box helicase [Halorarum halobium]|uniref:DEAD/DEAH box helicase n=1 Tax=Halorarum halobium TaxID=3075121 RepID=UPI0028A5FB0A|nr:DEAD/DEAH box helicase [Halobaculum sp. XH14]